MIELIKLICTRRQEYFEFWKYELDAEVPEWINLIFIDNEKDPLIKVGIDYYQVVHPNDYIVRETDIDFDVVCESNFKSMYEIVKLENEKYHIQNLVEALVE